MVVGGGVHLKLPSAAACCAACLAHNSARPRPRGRLNATTWVYNHDRSHPQASECWLKRHAAPWADMQLLAGGSRSWTTGVVVLPPPRVMGVATTSRSCGDARWRSPSATEPLYPRPAVAGVHSEELSVCPAVLGREASVALEFEIGGGGPVRVRLRLNRAASPKAVAWIESVLDAGTCANRSRAHCHPHCCNFYRAEAVVGVHRLPDAILRAHSLDPEHPPAWGRAFWWGPPYGFLQGRLWHGVRAASARTARRAPSVCPPSPLVVCAR